MERRLSQENPVELIDSGQFLVAEEIFSERRTDDPMEVVVRSEVAMYFDRIEEGTTLLEQVAPRVTSLDVAARFSLARGRMALWKGDPKEADAPLQTAYHLFLFQNDSFGISQALLELARLARRRGEFDDAVTRISAAQEGITGRVSKKMEFLRGQITAEQAALALDRGEVEQATELFSEAARILKGVERGRFYARSLMGMADLKCALGEFQDSLDLYKEANTVFERYDIKRDISGSYLKLAEALMRLKRFDRAEKLAEESRDVWRGKNPAGESVALAMLAKIALLKNEIDEATSRAASAIENAEKTSSDESHARARIAMGVVDLAKHEFKSAAESLTKAAEHGRALKGSSEGKLIDLEATIYLAEAYHNFDTRAGRTELLRASDLLNTLEDAWLGDEYNRVSTKYEEQIILTDDNRLVFDGNQLPRWQEAKRTLEGFLLRNALRQTNNSLTRAARKLGVSKVHVHNLKKKHGM
jgi:tetratricopeptide (TPR) repeat protein